MKETSAVFIGSEVKKMEADTIKTLMTEATVSLTKVFDLIPKGQGWRWKLPGAYF